MSIKIENIKVIEGEVRAKAWTKDGKPKLLFQPNKLWDFLRKVFSCDVKIPFVTGYYAYEVVRHNDITAKGKELVATGMINTVEYMAIGIGTPGTLALGSEITTGGGERAAATTSLVSIDTTNDTAQWVKLYTFTDDFLITEEGLFDQVAIGGNMMTSWTMAGLDMKETDSLQLTHRIKVVQSV